MMYSISIVMIAIYALAMLFIFAYSIIQLHLVYLYGKHKKKTTQALEKLDAFPKVTVQLPVYNELYVVEKLLDCVANFDYPSEQLEIQILDDSTDETTQIIQQKIQDFPKLDIQLIRRPNREGYKAGALDYGLKMAKGQFIAIFDADFQPKADFLQQTVPYFHDENIGVVQSKWEHINEEFSLLTRLQAFGLNAHFTIEQSGRNYGKHYINFNGTAGIWRKSCIEDAGGWQSDTLTEDLDLSYRAQMKGWQFKYLQKVKSPAELPVAINALKTQQFRWTKGAAECAVKNLPKLLKAQDISLSTKIHGVFHLLNSTVFIAIFLLGMLSVPLLWVKNHFPSFNLLFNIAGVFMLSFVFLFLFYFVSLVNKGKTLWRTTGEFLYKFPLFLAFSMGLSLHNSIAVLEGFMGKKSPFIRTPKFDIQQQQGKWYQNKYLVAVFTPVSVLEFLMFLYYLYGIYLAFQVKDYGLLPLHVLLATGYGAIFYYTLTLFFKKKSSLNVEVPKAQSR